MAQRSSDMYLDIVIQACGATANRSKVSTVASYMWIGGRRTAVIIARKRWGAAYNFLAITLDQPFTGTRYVWSFYQGKLTRHVEPKFPERWFVFLLWLRAKLYSAIKR